MSKTYYFKDTDICKKMGYLVGSLNCIKCDSMEYYSLDEKRIKCHQLEVIKSEEFSDKLTKREHFAFEFAKEYLRESLDSNRQAKQGESLFEYAVANADELIKALNEEKNETP